MLYAKALISIKHITTTYTCVITFFLLYLHL